MPSTPELHDLGTDEIGDLGRVAEALRCNTVASVHSYNDSRAALTGMIGRVSAGHRGCRAGPGFRPVADHRHVSGRRFTARHQVNT